MITLWRILQAGGRNFLRNAWLSTAATAVMAITLILMTFSYISNSALRSTIKSVTDKIDISIYIKDSVTPDQIKTLESQLQNTSNVQSVRLVTKADAWEEYKKQNPASGQVQSILGADNPLPASLQIKVNDPNKMQAVSDVINQPNVKALESDAPSYSGERKTVVDRIIHLSDFSRRASLVASIIFVVISMLIIFNTIRMAIFTRRSEIEIMQLVGATNWFIRGPFIVEAAMYGVIAAVLALVFCYSVLLVGASRLGGYIPISSTITFFKSNTALVVLAELVAGMLIGAIASVLAMSRHLKL